MDARVVEAVPSTAFGPFAVPLQVRDAVVARDIVLTGYVEDAVGPDALEHFVGRVELLGLGQLGDVTGVEHERRALGQRVQLVHRLAKRRVTSLFASLENPMWLSLTW